MDLILRRDRISRSQVVKQTDVVALLGLLPDELADDTGAANFHYYDPCCSYGSSLSKAMHGYVAAQLGLTDLALRYFHETTDINLGTLESAVVAFVSPSEVASRSRWCSASRGSR